MVSSGGLLHRCLTIQELSPEKLIVYLFNFHDKVLEINPSKLFFQKIE